MIKKLLLCLLMIGSAHAEPFDGWTDEEKIWFAASEAVQIIDCLLYTSPSPRD